MKKRYRMPVAKNGELLVKYGKLDGTNQLLYCYPDNTTRMRGDSNLLIYFFEGKPLDPKKSLIEELTDRGYDITTLKFSIMKKEIENEIILD